LQRFRAAGGDTKQKALGSNEQPESPFRRKTEPCDPSRTGEIATDVATLRILRPPNEWFGAGRFDRSEVRAKGA